MTARSRLWVLEETPPQHVWLERANYITFAG